MKEGKAFPVLGDGSLEDLAVSAVSIWEEPSRDSVPEMEEVQAPPVAVQVLGQRKAWQQGATMCDSRSFPRVSDRCGSAIY